jgi:LacI family transcriptional regulator
MKRPTQADVARLAGVSNATVSYVLNNDPKNTISPETRQRVLDAIDELGYMPDSRARSLRSGSTQTIGVLLPIYENPYFWQIMMGISTEAEVHDFSVLLVPSSGAQPTQQQEYRLIRELAQQRVDGIIMMMTASILSDSIIDQLRESTKPIVQITSEKYEFDSVFGSYDQGTKELMEHLFQLGHQRIGLIFGVAETPQGNDRLFAYQQCLEEANLPVDQSLIERCGQTMEDGYKATLNALQRPNRPTALLVINDLLGIAAIRAATDLGLRIPADVSIASFDNIPFANYVVPRLTTVSSDPSEQGRRAVQLLLRRLDGEELPPEVLNPGSTLIIRESTGPAPNT